MYPTRLLPLALAATALLVTACGTSDEASDPGTSPSPSASSSSSPAPASPSPSGTPKPKPQPEPSRPPSSEKPVRGLVSAGGAAEGDLEKTATPLPDEAAIRTYAATLGTSLQTSFTTKASTLLAHVPAGQRLYAQTVYDGCEAPDPATITATTSGADVVLQVTPPKSTKIQCLVAERSVALLSTDIAVG
ncbi:hypothetical protein SAMN05428985_109128 [Nocardioides sp. YR527]|uniref:hypothetical protein n=1 Tax=Nocardioides sp. YR527 TaxID=1881028 RepID=UPI0008926358|nr:hypothetical protein [Nocardioides sp. YR527]SDL09626.1 hypothetical protein SAMN05428985_109128 [Nocardioides sp. YR527]